MYRCTTVTQDRLVSVLRVSSRPRSEEREDEVGHSVHWAVWKPTGVAWELSDFGAVLGDSSTLRRLALAGPWVAVALAGCDGRYMNGCSEGVQRLNVASGHVEYDVGPPFGQPPECEPRRSGSVVSPAIAALVLAPTGAIAWIQGSELCELAPRESVPKLLATSAAIDPRSLEITDGFLIWRDGEALASTPFG